MRDGPRSAASVAVLKNEKKLPLITKEIGMPARPVSLGEHWTLVQYTTSLIQDKKRYVKCKRGHSPIIFCAATTLVGRIARRTGGLTACR